MVGSGSEYETWYTGYTAFGDMQSMASVKVTRYGSFRLQLAGLATSGLVCYTRH